MAMDQPPPTPPTVAEQVNKKTMEGVAGLLQRLGPGMQQRGQQAQRQQAREMVGGMPSMGAPNMQGMANGGIVGYEKGGEIEIQPMMGPPEPNMVQRAGQGLMNYGANAQESMGILQEVKAGIGIPYEERSAVMKQVRDEIAAQNQNRDPNFLEKMGRKLMDVGLNIEESKAIIKKFYNTFGKTYEEMSNGMAQGGIVGFAGPTGSSVGGMGAEGAFGDFTDRRNYMGETDEDIQNEFLKLSRDLANTDVDAAVSAESDRFKELTGADDLMAERKAKSAALEAQREARFSPEETRRRRISAGLAGLAERGLGGFGAGDIAERDKISAEQIAASEASLADMDKLIEDLRELGMGQFEAEKQARDMVERGIDQGMNTAQAVVDSIRRAQDAAANRATQERGQDITREVGLAQVAVPTDFMNEIQIRVSALQMDNPSLSKIEAQKQALEERIEAQAKAQLAANGVRAETLELERLKAAYSMAASRLANNPLAVTDYKAYRRAFDEEVKNITAQFMTPSGGNTGAGVPVPSSANDLVVGTVYNTARGPATWNGTSFIPVN
jgi:hypothetical protein